jgi:preprotein translocase subunit SecF
VRGLIRRLYQGETKIDFIGKRRLWFAISLAVVAVSIGWIVAREAPQSCSPPLPRAFKGLSCGIEFRGGVSIQAPISDTGPLADATQLEVIEEVRAALSGVGGESPQVQVTTNAATGERSVLVQTEEIDDPEVQQEVVSSVSETVGATIEETDSQRIGSKWGGEITSKAVRALVIFLLVILAFISLRFEWKMAVSAIAALFHDLIITAGIYSIAGFEVTPSTVIAILTILGYSLYDTVVVFDKVEENTTLLATTGRMTYQDSANLAMNQVFMRSLNTSLATLLPVAALLIVGGGLLGANTLEDLALALFVGILTGAYSSIFLATPLLAMLKEREPKYQTVRDRISRDARRHAPAPEEGDGEVESAAPPRELAAVGPKSPRPTSPARPPAGSKKARRRRRR